MDEIWIFLRHTHTQMTRWTISCYKLIFFHGCLHDVINHIHFPTILINVGDVVSPFYPSFQAPYTVLFRLEYMIQFSPLFLIQCIYKHEQALKSALTALRISLE